MSQEVLHAELRGKTQQLLQGALRHARAAALAAALVPLGAVAVSPAVAQGCGSGGCTPTETPTYTLGTPLATPTETPTQTAGPVGLCGNGMVDPGETCEPPGSTQPPNGNLCRDDCTFCGDGTVQSPPETCDTGGVSSRSCQSDCTGRLLRDPGSIKFHAAGSTRPDRLQVNGLIIPTHSIDPTDLMVGVRLSNASGVIYSGELPAGAMTTGGRRFKFLDGSAKANPDGGIAEFRLAPHKDGYRARVVAYGDLSAATSPDMTVEVFFGQGQYTNTGTWISTAHGWRVTDHTIFPP